MTQRTSTATPLRVPRRRIGPKLVAYVARELWFPIAFTLAGFTTLALTVQLLALAAFGMGLCLLYWRTGSIIPCMALHALNNSITFGVTTDLEPALFGGVVVLSVGSVIGTGMAVASRRPAAVAA